MAGFQDAWGRVPLPVRAIVVGMLVAAAGTLPWAWLADENLHHLPTVPWGPLAMAAYLWCYWRYATGHGWPASTAHARRESARVRPIDGSLWGIAIAAGILGLWFSVSFVRLIGRFVVIPSESPGDLSRVSPIALVAIALMSGVVAGVVEEISFRGYMQRPLERRFGPVVAIVVVGVVFGLAHASHAYWSLVLLPYYMAVAAVFGGLAYLTDSVVPSMVVHGTGDALSALLAVAGAGTFGMPGAAEPKLGTPGATVMVAINVVVLVATGLATVWAFRDLAKAARRTTGERMNAPGPGEARIRMRME